MRQRLKFQKIILSVVVTLTIINLGKWTLTENQGSGNFPGLNILKGGDLSYVPDESCSEIDESLAGFKFHMCAYDVISWEVVQVQLILSILEVYPSATFLDVGSNTGVFSLPVAMSGIAVVSVDAMYKNMAYLHKSAVLNGVQDKIVMIHNAVSDVYTTYLPAMDNNMLGGSMSIRIIEEKDVNAGEIKTDGNKGWLSSSPLINNTIKVDYEHKIKSVALRDLLDFIDTDTVIIKMDIEGSECKAFTNYLKNRDKNKYIPYILMEWVTINNKIARRTNCPQYHSLVTGFIEAGYLPYTPEATKIQDLEEKDVINVLWKHITAKDIPYLAEIQEEFTII